MPPCNHNPPQKISTNLYITNNRRNIHFFTPKATFGTVDYAQSYLGSFFLYPSLSHTLIMHTINFKVHRRTNRLCSCQGINYSDLQPLTDSITIIPWFLFWMGKERREEKRREEGRGGEERGQEGRGGRTCQGWKWLCGLSDWLGSGGRARTVH